MLVGEQTQLVASVGFTAPSARGWSRQYAGDVGAPLRRSVEAGEVVANRRGPWCPGDVAQDGGGYGWHHYVADLVELAGPRPGPRVVTVESLQQPSLGGGEAVPVGLALPAAGLFGEAPRGTVAGKQVATGGTSVPAGADLVAGWPAERLGHRGCQELGRAARVVHPTTAKPVVPSPDQEQPLSTNRQP